MIDFNPLAGLSSGSIPGRLRKLALLGLLFCGCAAADAKIIYVDGAVAAPGDGTKWKKAFSFLQDALEVAVKGDSIYIAQGTYYPDDGVENGFGDREISFVLDGLNLYGGFDGTETDLSQRDPEANPTRLSGEIWPVVSPETQGYERYWSLHVVVLKSSSTLDGLIVEKGRANGDDAPYSQGGGVLAPAGTVLTVNDCIFDGNLANQSGGAVWGEVIATDSTFSNNVVDNEQLLSSSPQRLNQWLFNPDCAGGAINGNVKSTRCLFVNNTVTVVSLDLGNISSATGGAIAGNVTALDSTFDSNVTTSYSYPLPFQLSSSSTRSRGGAISGTVTATRCAFVNNGCFSQADADTSPDPKKLVPYTSTAVSEGGAVAGQITSTNCYYANNEVFADARTGDFTFSIAPGGALYAQGNSTVVNSVFLENAAFLGGAIHIVDGGFMPVTDSTFMDNGTAGSGAAVSSSGSVNILSNVFWYTDAAATNGYAKDQLIFISGRGRISNRLYPTPSTETFNVVRGGLAAVARSLGANVDLGDPPTRSLLNLDPLFVNDLDAIGPDLIWGTADDGLRITSGSSAIGLGKPLFLPADTQDLDSDGNTTELIPIDAAGFARIQDGVMDVGAYEFGDNLNTPDINVEQPLGTLLEDGVSVVDFSANYGVATSFLIRNTGLTELRNLVITLDGADAGDFKFTQPALKLLNPGETTTFTVTFVAKVGGLKTAAIHIGSNDPDESPFDIVVQGDAVLPDIAVEYPAGTPLADDTSTVGFGKVGLGASLTKTFTINNTGPGTLVIQGISFNGANAASFSATPPVQSSLASGQSTTFDLTLTPVTTGSLIASVVITSNDPDTESSYLINLTGNGIGSPEISVKQPFSAELVDGQTNDFGSVEISSTYSKTFVVKNTGTATLKNIQISVSGSSTFSTTVFPVTKLAVGQQQNFTVTFRPGSVGPKSAALQIKSNDLNESVINVSLIGNGISKTNKKKNGAAVASTLASSSPLQAAGWLASQTRDTVSATLAPDGGKYLVLTVEKTAGWASSAHQVEVSSNLVDWYSGAKHTTVLVDNESLLQVRDNTPVGNGGKRYIRLK